MGNKDGARFLKLCGKSKKIKLTLNIKVLFYALWIKKIRK